MSAVGAGTQADGRAGGDAVIGLIQRLLPDHWQEFAVEQLDSEDGGDVFELETVDGIVTLRGPTGVAQASALNWYLKYHCDCHVSWDANQLQLPARLPKVGKVRRGPRYRYRHYPEYCMFGYTAPYWKWERWEREIDWMALNGINLPLALTGHEAVWLAVFRGLGFDEERLRHALTAPTHLPFQWQGFFDNFDGRPLPAAWIEGHLDLGQRIIERERAFGMKPVLHAFTGHVPRLVAEAYEGDVSFHANRWANGLPERILVDPSEPLFAELAVRFVEEATRIFGSDHLYMADPFEEVAPPDTSLEFLRTVGRTIYQSLAEADPDAVWLMHSWPFYFMEEYWTNERIAAFLDSVPDERILILDTYGEYAPQWWRTQAFYGKPWLWSCTISFGGYGGVYGNLAAITEGPPGIGEPSAGALSGIGVVTEAIEQNPIVYDLLTELAWREAPSDLDGWVRDFVRRRYGKEVPQAEAAWGRLAETVYASSGNLPPRSLICERPARHVRARIEMEDEVSRPAERGYDPLRVRQAWPLLLESGDYLADSAAFRHDLVDVAVQILSDYTEDLYASMMASFGAGDAERLRRLGTILLDLLSDVDALLRTHPDRLLGRWLSGARAWGMDDEEASAYELDARRILTLWATRETWALHDYSGRLWSGLVDSLYRPRWQLFLQELEAALVSPADFDDARFEGLVVDLEADWLRGSEAYPTEPAGDAVALAREMYDDRYRGLLEPDGAVTGQAEVASERG